MAPLTPQEVERLERIEQGLNSLRAEVERLAVEEPRLMVALLDIVDYLEELHGETRQQGARLHRYSERLRRRLKP